MKNLPEEGRRVLARLRWGSFVIGMRVGDTFCNLNISKDIMVEFCHIEYLFAYIEKWAYLGDVDLACSNIWRNKND